MAVATPTTGMNGVNRETTRELGRDLTREVPYKGLVTSAQGMTNERKMAPNLTTPNLNSSDNLFVANLQQVSLEKLVKSKLEVMFQQQKEAQVELNGLYNVIIEQVEKPLLELALRAYNGNQVKTAQMLGINVTLLRKRSTTAKSKLDIQGHPGLPDLDPGAQ